MVSQDDDHMAVWQHTYWHTLKLVLAPGLLRTRVFDDETKCKDKHPLCHHSVCKCPVTVSTISEMPPRPSTVSEPAATSVRPASCTAYACNDAASACCASSNSWVLLSTPSTTVFSPDSCQQIDHCTSVHRRITRYANARHQIRQLPSSQSTSYKLPHLPGAQPRSTTDSQLAVQANRSVRTLRSHLARRHAQAARHH